MIRSPKTLVTLLVVASITALGFAGPAKWQTKMFENGDKDGNGSLTLAEYKTVRLKGMKKNAEKQNREFDAEKAKKRLATQFAKFDKDGDNELSSEEFFASFAPKKKKDS